jgi:hypothetical protein
MRTWDEREHERALVLERLLLASAKEELASHEQAVRRWRATITEKEQLIRVMEGAPCNYPLGDRPEWMSPDQWDPCPCDLAAGHEGPHFCKHLRGKVVKDDA